MKGPPVLVLALSLAACLSIAACYTKRNGIVDPPSPQARLHQRK